MASTSGALHIPFMAHVTNQEVCSRTGQPTVISLVKSQRLKLFGHNTRVELAQDCARALRASISCLPEDWRRMRGRPCQLWLRSVEADLKPLNFASVQHVSVRPIVPSGGVSWKQLCSWTGVPPHDDDDDDVAMHFNFVHKLTVPFSCVHIKYLYQRGVHGFELPVYF